MVFRNPEKPRFIVKLTGLLSFMLVMLFFLALGFAVFIGCGWIKDVLLGKMTTSQYMEKWDNYRRHPDHSPLGKYVQEMMQRAKH